MWFSCAKESRIPWSEAAATAPPALGETATENVLRAMRRLALRRAAQLFLPRGYIEGCGLEGNRASSGLRALRRVPAWCPRGTKFQQRRANPAAAVHSCLQSLAQGQGSWSSRKPVDQEGLHLPFRDPSQRTGSLPWLLRAADRRDSPPKDRCLLLGMPGRRPFAWTSSPRGSGLPEERSLNRHRAPRVRRQIARHSECCGNDCSTSDASSMRQRLGWQPAFVNSFLYPPVPLALVL
jgi:hypothetical protein